MPIFHNLTTEYFVYGRLVGVAMDGWWEGPVQSKECSVDFQSTMASSGGGIRVPWRRQCGQKLWELSYLVVNSRAVSGFYTRGEGRE